MSLIRLHLRNFGWLSIERFLRIFSGIFVYSAIARYLGPDEFGKLSYILAVIAIIASLSTFGMHDILVKDFVEDNSRSPIIVSSAIIIFLFGSILSFISTICFFMIDSDSFNNDLGIATLLASTTLFKISEVAICWFEAKFEVSKYVKVNILSLVIFSLSKIAAIYFNFTLFEVSILIFLETVFVSIILMIALISDLGGLNIRFLSFQKIAYFFQKSWPLLVTLILTSVHMRIDQILIGQYLGAKSVGIYNAAVRLSEIWYFIPLALGTSFYPWMIKARIEIRSKSKLHLQNLLDLLTWSSICIALLITFASPFLINLLYGGEYSTAARVLSIHIWTLPLVSIGVAGSRWMIAEGLQLLLMQRAIVSCFLSIILNVTLIPIYHENAGAISLIITQLIATLILDGFQSRSRELFKLKINSFNILAAYKRSRVFFNDSVRPSLRFQKYD